MLFQTHYRLDPFAFEPDLCHFRSREFQGEGLTFLIRYEQPEDEDSESVIHVLMTAEVSLPDELRSVFFRKETGAVNVDAIRFTHDFEGFPVGYEQFVLNTHRKLERYASGIFNDIRWRVGIMGGPVTLRSEWKSMRWENPEWDSPHLKSLGFLNSQIPAGGTVLHLNLNELSIPGECLLDLREHQPLSHSLLREAWNNRNDAPRSALVIGISAAEIGFKETASDLMPDTKWLLSNIQSPPLDKMIREFMEKLPARQKFEGVVCRPPKPLIRTLKRGIELRNGAVHSASEEISSETIQEILEAVRDLLYLLDYYRGESWALERISNTVLEALKSEAKTKREE